MVDQVKREMRRQRKLKRTEVDIGRRCNINADKVQRLIEAGYDTLKKIRNATNKELKAIPGIGLGQIKKIREGIDGGGEG